MIPDSQKQEMEKAILVGVILPRNQRWEVEENLAELKLLAATSGVEVVDELLQERRQINPTYFIGKGKVDELHRMVKMYGISTVIFDDDLTPAQGRNLEKALDVKIVDRSILILDIFARHARTREAKTQVELAQLKHLLPRLTRQWTHLSRQVGGIGTKGPGETQLETDRRLIRNRIETLQKELEKIDQRRVTRRQGRKGCFKISLVGYTNVGKSTLMNLLTDAEVLVENQLFATLDSTIRRLHLGNHYEVLLSDTVGFIRKLPHQLIASFKSTLDEVAEADLLLHVVDVSHPAFQEQIHTVNEVIREIGAGETPTLMVFNKIDLLKEKAQISALKKQYPESVFISATQHIRTQHLKKVLSDFIERNFVEKTIRIPIQLSGLVNRVHRMAVVLQEDYSGEYITMRFKCNPADYLRILRMVKTAMSENGKSLPREAEELNGEI